jgi:hypothetical protein
MRHLLGLVVLSASASACSVSAGEPGTPDAGDSRDVAVIRVVDDGLAVDGARVVFHDASGAVAGVVRADVVGVAKFPIEPGGLVTVAFPNDIVLTTSRIQLLTFTDVDPGDDVTVEIPSFGAVPPTPYPSDVAGSLRLELPPLENAGSYVVDLGCENVTTDQLVTIVDVPKRCLGSDDTVDITVNAYTPPDLPSHLGTTYANRIPVSADAIGDVALPDWVTPHPTIDVAFTDQPEGATNVFAVATMLADGEAFDPIMADTAALAGEPVTLSPGFIADFAEQIDLEVRVHAGVANMTTLFLLSAPVEVASSVTGDALLPTVRDVEVDASGGAIAWTNTGDVAAAGADATFLHLRSERREGVVTRHRRWTITTAPDTASPFVLPELPPELDDYRPRPGDDYFDPGIVTFDADWIAGYDAFVSDHGTRFLDDACVPAYSTARLTRTGVFYGPTLTTSAY